MFPSFALHGERERDEDEEEAEQWQARNTFHWKQFNILPSATRLLLIIIRVFMLKHRPLSSSQFSSLLVLFFLLRSKRRISDEEEMGDGTFSFLSVNLQFLSSVLQTLLVIMIDLK